MTHHSDWEFFQDEGYFGMWCVREKGARRFGEGFHTVSKEEAEALASALSSQSLSLSEAREEIERLSPYREELQKIAADVGEPDDPFAAWEAIAALKARLAIAEKALKPFAAVAKQYDSADHTRKQAAISSFTGWLTIGHFRAAVSVLENGPAGLGGSSHG